MLIDYCVENQAHNLQLILSDYFSDPDGDALYYSAAENMDFLLTSVEDDILTLSFIDDLYGSGELTVSANDGEYSVDISFSVTVGAVNDAPVVTLELNDITVNEDSEPQAIDLSIHFIFIT